MSKIVKEIKHIRGPIGNFFKWLFILFNGLMLFWLFSYWINISDLVSNTSSEIESAGAAIGSTIGTGIILTTWALGAIFLGIPVMLTKGKYVEIETTEDKVQSAISATEKVHISDAHEKLKLGNNTSMQVGVGIIFVCFGIIAMATSFPAGLLIIVAGTLFFPKIRAKLVDSPIGKDRTLTITSAILFVLALYIIGNSAPISDADSVLNNDEQIETNKNDLRKEAEKAFTKNPEQALQEIATYAKNNNWSMVQEKTELLLDNGNEQIIKLHEKAVAELAKVENERLITEFKEKRNALITDLKKEMGKGNFANAERIGSEYLTVADNEFKKLHDIATEKQTKEATATPWSYSHTDDPMSKGVTHIASLASSNTVDFKFPYSGSQHGRLTLRTSPQYGKDVIFSIEKGQILCPSYDSCTVRVRFDEGDAVSYTAVGAADNSTETIFFSNYGRFVEKMMKANRVRLSVNVYQEGAPVFDFDVSGFNEAKYKHNK